MYLELLEWHMDTHDALQSRLRLHRRCRCPGELGCSTLGIVPLGHDMVEELATSVELHDNIPKEGVFG
jgi:hypothetical protein